MNQIIFLLRPEMQGSAVADLQIALLLLSAINSSRLSQRPMVKELKALAERLKQEQVYQSLAMQYGR